MLSSFKCFQCFSGDMQLMPIIHYEFPQRSLSYFITVSVSCILGCNSLSLSSINIKTDLRVCQPMNSIPERMSWFICDFVVLIWRWWLINLCTFYFINYRYTCAQKSKNWEIILCKFIHLIIKYSEPWNLRQQKKISIKSNQ